MKGGATEKQEVLRRNRRLAAETLKSRLGRNPQQRDVMTLVMIRRDPSKGRSESGFIRFLENKYKGLRIRKTRKYRPKPLKVKTEKKRRIIARHVPLPPFIPENKPVKPANAQVPMPNRAPPPPPIAAPPIAKPQVAAPPIAALPVAAPKSTVMPPPLPPIRAPSPAPSSVPSPVSTPKPNIDPASNLGFNNLSSNDESPLPSRNRFRNEM
jgi:hypothetical protein